MAPIRVLVAEDSATVREHLCDILRSDHTIEVVGAVPDGRQAFSLCRELRPDVVTMDMMMPVMTGLAATENIMAYCPTPILVVSASMNRGEVFHTYDALAAGAVDVIEKPTGSEPEGEWEKRFLDTVKLVSRIHVITHLKARARAATDARAAFAASSPGGGGGPPIRLLAIGASTGGPGAAVEVFRGLPPDLPVPILFVLHINAQFGFAFADWLNTQTPWRARFPRDGEHLSDAVGSIILAPPDRHIVVRDDRIWIDNGPERFSCRPSVDVMFESMAADCGGQTAAALLTGMGKDGAAGLLSLRLAGAVTIAQDESTSVVFGMPREAANAGAASRVLPLREIGPALAGVVRARGARL
jgi:two-component system, chemotaxis family, protein-glutamate methylesterase/glutaminase